MDPLDVASLEARFEALTAALARERAAIRHLEVGGGRPKPEGGGAPGFKHFALGLLLGLGAGFVLRTIFYLFASGYGID
jgi:hypothetical protein